MESLLVATELGIYRMEQIKTFGWHSIESEDPVFAENSKSSSLLQW